MNVDKLIKMDEEMEEIADVEELYVALNMISTETIGGSINMDYDCS